MTELVTQDAVLLELQRLIHQARQDRETDRIRHTEHIEALERLMTEVIRRGPYRP